MVDIIQDADDATERARTTPLGIYDRPRQDSIRGIEMVAIGATAVWLVCMAVAFLVMPSDVSGDAGTASELPVPLALMTIVLPVGMIWVIATAARASKTMREESQRVQVAIDAIRQSYISQSQNGAFGAEPASVARKLDEIAAATRKTETVLATFSSRRDAHSPSPNPAPVAAASRDDQPRLALGTEVEEASPPLDNADFIRALNFPETAQDEAGFVALRRALRNRPSAQLVQAAQDVLTLLSQDGIYMDDLTPDRARPEIWRNFGQGLRGRPIAALGGIRDRSSLALSAGRMKQDPIFRDAAHHFLRLFDKTFAEFEKRATDSEIAALAETRTARAFMLLGRVAGTFD